jgi:serine phosphatase RsbU (regulator of sigma subunit)
MAMTLRYKFVLPINLVLVLVLGISLAWEWRRQESAALSLLRVRLDEEARFVQAAYRTFGDTPRFATFLHEFCHAIDPSASPGHQVAVWDKAGGLMASAAEHAQHRPMDLSRLATLGEGFWTLRDGEEPFLVRVSADGGRRVVVAESTRAVRERVWTNLRGQLVWPLSTGVLLLVVINAAMRRAVLRPVRRLYRAARLIEQGQLGTQIEIDFDGADELGTLSRQFNSMSLTLAEQAEANRREMETAHRVQANLLPPPVFRLGCLEVAGRCLPAGPVGGDIYDVQLLPGDRVGVLVADLSGHNVAAALHTAMVRAIVWHEAEQAKSPGEVLTRLNERLCRDLPGGHFATAFFGWFDAHTNRLHYASAGHPSAFLQAAAGCLRELEATGPLLGVLPNLSHADASIAVGSGVRLLVLTDGLTETQDPGGELWGTAELLTLLEAGRSSEPGRLVDQILARAAAFRHGRPQQDDVTIVLACYDSLQNSENAPYVSRGSAL